MHESRYGNNSCRQIAAKREMLRDATADDSQACQQEATQTIAWLHQSRWVQTDAVTDRASQPLACLIAHLMVTHWLGLALPQ